MRMILLGRSQGSKTYRTCWASPLETAVKVSYWKGLRYLNGEGGTFAPEHAASKKWQLLYLGGTCGVALLRALRHSKTCADEVGDDSALVTVQFVGA